MKTPRWLQRLGDSLNELGKPATITRPDGHTVTIYTNLAATSGTSPVTIVEEKEPGDTFAVKSA